MRELSHTASSRQSNKTTTTITTLLIVLMFIAGPLQAADDATESDSTRVTQLAQTDAVGEQTAEEEILLEEVIVVGSQIKGAAISEALAVSVIDAQEIEAMGISSGDELLEQMPEIGQNTFNNPEVHSGGVNSVRGDVGAFNLRNMGTGNTLALINGRRMVNAAGYQTEEVGGAFVPVNTVNSNALPVFGVQRVEVLRDGASAIYGADAVAGVINTVLKSDFEGFNIRVRFDEFENIPRNDYRVNGEWGRFFNSGRTNFGVFFDFYHRDRVSAQDDPKWADENYSRFVEGEWVSVFGTNYSTNSSFPQIDFRSSSLGRAMRDLGLADSSGEIQTFPAGDERCTFEINDVVCGAPDSSANTYRHNKNLLRDVYSELDRYNLYMYLNHEFENGVESYTELSFYEASSNLKADGSYFSIGASDLQIGPEYYYNPFGPCDSPNRLPESVIGTAIPCSGTRLEIDTYRVLEVPRSSDTDNHIYRFLQGFRGTWGENWDWDTALVWSEAKRTNITHNRISNTIMQEMLDSSSPSTYNIFNGEEGDINGLQPALVDVYRKDSSDLLLVDFKLTNSQLFNMPAGPVGFLAGVEYREESFKDNRDPRLDGTIAFTSYEGATFPYVSDVANSSPTADNSGERDVTSLMTEFAIPLFENFDLQAALRYEDFSDVESTTVGKLAFGWRVFEPLLIRGSWSEAFRAPNLITINEALVVRNNTRDDYVCLYAAIETGVDPNDMDGDCDWSTQRRASGSENLKPEESTNTSIGMVWDPTENLTFTLDFWTIEKENTIGLFGEENHTKLDLLYRIRAGLADCTQDFNTAVGRGDIDADDAPVYVDAGICPAGQLEYVEDTYTNLSTRTIEGYDVGVYYNKDTDFGDFGFKFVGTVYEKYEQNGSEGAAKEVDDALKSGELPEWITLRGYGDLMSREGNSDKKYNASLRWSRNSVAAYISMLYVSKFYDADTSLDDGTKWWLKSMTTYNASFDYRFDAFDVDTRLRFGINNLTDERAPLCDCRFGYWSDAHRDMGRSYYVDLRMSF